MKPTKKNWEDDVSVCMMWFVRQQATRLPVKRSCLHLRGVCQNWEKCERVLADRFALSGVIIIEKFHIYRVLRFSIIFLSVFNSENLLLGHLF